MGEIKSHHLIDIIGLPEQHNTEESEEEEQTDLSSCHWWVLGFRVYPNPKP
jgi:hypothetical protein